MRDGASHLSSGCAVLVLMDKREVSGTHIQVVASHVSRCCLFLIYIENSLIYIAKRNMEGPVCDLDILGFQVAVLFWFELQRGG